MKIANLWKKSKPSIFAGFAKLRSPPLLDKKKPQDQLKKGRILRCWCQVFHTHLPDWSLFAAQKPPKKNEWHAWGSTKKKRFCCRTDVRCFCK